MYADAIVEDPLALSREEMGHDRWQIVASPRGKTNLLRAARRRAPEELSSVAPASWSTHDPPTRIEARYFSALSVGSKRHPNKRYPNKRLTRLASLKYTLP